MDDDLIIAALQQGVTAAVAASINPALPVKYIDTDIVNAAGVVVGKPDDGKWLELVWIPNNRNGDFLGDEKNYQGIFRLVLHWPVEQKGTYGPLQLLKSIAGYFSKGRLLSGVQIYETADFTGALNEPSEVLYPASIRYQSYRS